ncbi:TFIIH/NER complex subunit [Saccharomycopsis crataegensis]|uniref:General transcription and DNA repair factor IIH subunit TFB4 n=1 Tax=Saccharomycopsis crataegensis TaxID=43959 RepID=A0AAV5QVI1_9ASCO|nr:TFIIH/NER complex subunit [Saccharomycopsis crataegensis]
MDAIADTTIAQAPGAASHATEDTPSLLAVVIETNPLFWVPLQQQTELKSVIESLIVAMNAHLAINNSNEVIVIAAHSGKAQFLFPDPNVLKNDTNPPKMDSHSPNSVSNKSTSPTPDVIDDKRQYLKNKNIYRQFKLMDESVFEKLEQLFNDTVADNSKFKSTVPGAISMALTFINRMRQVREGITMNSRILVASVGGDQTMSYIPTMNSIFAAQGMRIPIDVCKLGNDSTFLQQAADVTGGIYLLITNPNGLIQYLTTVFFIDPSIRNYVALPVNNNIDFRASCFITGNIVDIGYVCSVCLCVLSMIPSDKKCPTCESTFDPQALEKLARKPFVKRKVVANGNSETPNATPTPAGTPQPK